MLNFAPIRNKEKTIMDLAQGLTPDDLRRLTREMVEAQRELIKNCVDADVVFVPNDPEANDTFAANSGDTNLAWTLGHVIVHTTASAEEYAFTAAELARGVDFHGRSRSEIPWQTATTIQQCRQRLEESQRMRLAALDVWPAQPYLENMYKPSEKAVPRNALGAFLAGLMHDDNHLQHLAKIVEQAKAAR